MHKLLFLRVSGPKLEDILQSKNHTNIKKSACHKLQEKKLILYLQKGTQFTTLQVANHTCFPQREKDVCEFKIFALAYPKIIKKCG